jgi:hypothetical protein
MSVSINGTNGLVFNDNSSQNTAASGFGFKNRIINGAMMIDQRNAGASVTPNNTYTLDRWYITNTQTSKLTVQQNAGSVTPPTGFTNYLGVTSSSAYSVLTGDTFLLLQPIEGLNVADLGWGTANAATVTLSFKVYSSLTGTFGGAFTNSAGNRSYPFSYTISSANTWTTVSVTIAGDTTGTWLTTNGIGIIVRFGLGSGSTYSGTAGSWTAGNIVQPTGSTSVVGTNGATFYITGVQLEKGSTATSFDYRPYGTELALCQRYYQNSFNNTQVGVSTSLSDAIHLVSWGDGNCSGFPFQVPMRTAPTVTLRPQGSTTTGQINSGGTDRVASATNIGVKQVSFITVNSGTANTYNRFTWEANGEL